MEVWFTKNIYEKDEYSVSHFIIYLFFGQDFQVKPHAAFDATNHWS